MLILSIVVFVSTVYLAWNIHLAAKQIVDVLREVRDAIKKGTA